MNLYRKMSNFLTVSHNTVIQSVKQLTNAVENQYPNKDLTNVTASMISGQLSTNSQN